MPLRSLIPLLGLALIAAPVSAETHQIDQVGLGFVPNDLTIQVGDTVEWIWSAGGHTVTEGLDDATPPIEEKFFDAPLTMTDTIVQFTFDEPGDVNYYCRPHLPGGMIGVIHVEAPVSSSEGVETQSFSETKGEYR